MLLCYCYCYRPNTSDIVLLETKVLVTRQLLVSTHPEDRKEVLVLKQKSVLVLKFQDFLLAITIILYIERT